jgi:hypothetical protein
MSRIDTVSTEVFTFDELSDEAKEYAIDKFRNNEWYPHDNWWEFVYEDFIENYLAPAGFDTDTSNMFFSGFWSQGDGACFDGRLDVLKFIEHYKLQEKFPLTYEVAQAGYCWGSIRTINHHYSHQNTRRLGIEQESEDALRLDVFNDDEEKLRKYSFEINDFETYAEETRYELADTLYKMLEKEYEDLTSDETVTEELRNNDYEFTVDGKIY